MAGKQPAGTPPVKARRAPTPTAPEPKAETLTTAIHLPRETWKLLRRVAFHRAEVAGGRASVSALLVELVEQHRAELEAELKP